MENTAKKQQSYALMPRKRKKTGVAKRASFCVNALAGSCRRTLSTDSHRAGRRERNNMTIRHTGGYVPAKMDKNIKAAIAWMLETGRNACKVGRMTIDHTFTSENLWTMRVSMMESEWSGLKEKVRFLPYRIED